LTEEDCLTERTYLSTSLLPLSPFLPSSPFLFPPFLFLFSSFFLSLFFSPFLFPLSPSPPLLSSFPSSLLLFFPLFLFFLPLPSSSPSSSLFSPL
ncbi:hypothetical protein ACXWR7_10275, partial [Streptococcus pyogenes]